MEDYIFLIIAVALSIYAAINKNKKGKIADSPVEEEDETSRNFFMDQLLGEDFLEEKKEVTTPLVKPQPAPANFAYKSSIDTGKVKNYVPSRFKSTLPQRPKRETIATLHSSKGEEDDKISGTKESVSCLKDFSLRKAFVYSQIMERKY